ncbi:MBL fold hydrolase [Actinorhabdospora filicis]|uniref:MBL fold hydrolase n=1 Tax=Actinorhabdospora filicis TaxID=1785913 RepID=A0A9W6WDY1_9ACTN|nr:MBL fold hydrolase [Actinorhabdospora filicis]
MRGWGILPDVPRSLERLSGEVWLYPGDPDPALVQGCVGVIATPEGSVVVDAGQSPAMARDVQAAIAEAGLPKATHLVYTHHHWDHTWGACAWDGVEVIGHETGAEILAEQAKLPWSPDYLEAEIAANNKLEPSYGGRHFAMKDCWDGFTIVPPHRTFTDRLELPGGIEVRHVGGNHAPDSSVVVVPEASVMLLGDAFYPPPFHLRKMDDTTDLAMIRAFLAEDFEWYVDAHNPPRRRRSVKLAAGLMTAAGRFRRRPRP